MVFLYFYIYFINIFIDMEKKDIESILLANFYFLSCKFDNPLCPKTDLARRFLIRKIKKVLNKNNRKIISKNLN